MHGRAHYLHELRYGFDDQNLYLRVDTFPEVLRELQEWEFRLRVSPTSRGKELRLTVRVENARLAGFQLESNGSDVTPSGPPAARLPPACAGRDGQERAGAEPGLEVAFDKILEVRIGRQLFGVPPRGTLSLGVGLWQGGLPVDLLPAEGSLEVRLGADVFAWELTEKS